jgi:hypothetical protein
MVWRPLILIICAILAAVLTGGAVILVGAIGLAVCGCSLQVEIQNFKRSRRSSHA